MPRQIMNIKRFIRPVVALCLLSGALFALAGCGHGRDDSYRDTSMDFGSVRTVAVMPFVNLSRDLQAGERVRDVFITSLLATGAVYVLPSGEVARNVAAAALGNASAPNTDEVMKFCKLAKVDAVITGVIREYGEIRSGTAISDVVSLSLQMMEGQTGKIVWTTATTKGGITFKDRLLGGGGQPLNVNTEKAAHELINKLFE